MQMEKESDFTARLNGHLDPNVRFMLDYVRVNAEDCPDPQVDDGCAHLFRAHLQIRF